MIFVLLQLNMDITAPLSCAVLPPCVPPKLVPVIVIALLTGPEVGEMLLMFAETPVTVKSQQLLGTPPTVTTRQPVVAPDGTGTAMLVLLQLVGVAVVPVNVTVPVVAPKLTPVIVTTVPTTPDVGDAVMILGAAVTVKATPLLATPETVTTMFPVVAPFGTGATIFVDVQLVGGAGVPLNVTVLVPWVDPKFVPVIVKAVPIEPDVGERLVMLGAVTTVKITPLLATPETVTTTFPVVAPDGTHATMLVALQLVAVAAMPPNLTVLVPCVVPKFVPASVTQIPTIPEVGFRLVMLGVAVTVNDTLLLGTPETLTTTFPLVAPGGTNTACCRSVKCDRADGLPGAWILSGAEISPRNCHCSSHGTGCRRQAGNVGRRHHRKIHTVTGRSTNGYNHTSSRCSRWHRHHDFRGAPACRCCRRSIELYRARALRSAKVCADYCDYSAYRT